jgi:hypothetical protein
MTSHPLLTLLVVWSQSLPPSGPSGTGQHPPALVFSPGDAAVGECDPHPALMAAWRSSREDGEKGSGVRAWNAPLVAGMAPEAFGSLHSFNKFY